MFQEALVQNPEIIEKAINFGAVGMNLLVMSLGAVIVMGLYVLRTQNTPVATPVWIRQNAWRFVVGSVLLVALAITLVVSPDVSAVMELIGFSVEKSTFALGAAIGLLIIGVTTEPSKHPEGQTK